jgi:protein phosphatase
MHNEDALFVDDSLGLWAVADGMGGHESGEVASSLAIQALAGAVRSGRSLKEAFGVAHQAVCDGCEAGLGGAGMGTTLTAVRARSGSYRLCWVGDSRAYAWDGRVLTALSRDHSLVQELTDAGEITAEQARSHPQRHLITRVLGAQSPAPAVDSLRGRRTAGSSLLLCSDGLTNELGEAEMTAILGRYRPSRDCVDALVEAALARGGHDNISVILVHFPAAVDG